MSSNSTGPLAYRWNEDRATDGVPITITCASIALFLVALRIYTRASFLKKVFLDDYVIVGAMAFSILEAVCIVKSFSYGAGRHFETVSAEKFANIRKVCIFEVQLHAMPATQQLIADSPPQIAPLVHIGYNAAHFLLKLSIIFQYMRISVMAFEKRLCYALTSILACGFIAFFITTLLLCMPLYAVWTPNVPGAVCLNTAVSMTANQIYLIVMDFAILIIPFFIIRHLTIPWPQRILLGLVLALGAIVPSALYAITEINVGIACSCIITFRPLFGRWQWFSRGEPKSLQVISPAQKPPRPRDPFSLSTDSTQILNDMELGGVHTTSYGGGSTRTGSRTKEDGEPVLPATSRPAVMCWICSAATTLSLPLCLRWIYHLSRTGVRSTLIVRSSTCAPNLGVQKQLNIYAFFFHSCWFRSVHGHPGGAGRRRSTGSVIPSADELWNRTVPLSRGTWFAWPTNNSGIYCMLPFIPRNTRKHRPHIASDIRAAGTPPGGPSKSKELYHDSMEVVLLIRPLLAASLPFTATRQHKGTEKFSQPGPRSGPSAPRPRFAACGGLGWTFTHSASGASLFWRP
ncbi:hypothetical protein MAPG_05943 [Magnaporthiopsis poae ATCC 64411]|uniref:Rhodopsin domain-containing protein n=1 Tax=Magnaporthiopsis poae (strain ATCC 64411 / 73-15) TaxID=644358 RepID=A0A0C4E0R1_MAGP6|nr:hypothetical protein MAPG_05943 [Magnaporthiopsis poae ATCC 64411]